MPVDIADRLTHKAFRKDWRKIVERSIEAQVDTLILRGTSMWESRNCLNLALTWLRERGTANLYFTAGFHPNEANQFDAVALQELKRLLQHPLCVAVGECGLDFTRNSSTRSVQMDVFREHVKLACELQMPLFVHEREAHEALIYILDDVEHDESIPKPIPPIVIHCFTGTQEQAQEYLRRGCFLGLTGFVCFRQRGAALREDVLPKLPLDRLMVETDAPYMIFKKNQRRSEPADVVDVARQIAETHGVPLEDALEILTATARRFFRLQS